MSYAKEKLGLAIRNSFLLGEGDSRERLSNGFQHYLFTLREEHFDKEDWLKFKKVQERLTHKGPVIVLGKVIIGSYENGKNHIRKRTASRLIEELVDIYNEL